MMQQGTMQNGVIVLDDPEYYLEGARVRLWPSSDQSKGEFPAAVPHPAESETQEEVPQGLQVEATRR